MVNKKKTKKKKIFTFTLVGNLLVFILSASTLIVLFSIDAFNFDNFESGNPVLVMLFAFVWIFPAMLFSLFAIIKELRQ